MFLSIPSFVFLSALPSTSLSHVGSFATQAAGPPLRSAEASVNASVQSLLSSTNFINNNILIQNFLAPLEFEVVCNFNVVRDGTAL
jgi:hypothetical protein